MRRLSLIALLPARLMKVEREKALSLVLLRGLAAWSAKTGGSA
ncbi:MAG TPA: hypothetical protein VJU83_06855 [Burkholderiales bacterium]|nr:hypothetical protein [Burkholderiales bacterium]